MVNEEFVAQSTLPNNVAQPSARTHFLINVSSNVAYMIATTLVMFWYIPFLIQHLGVAAYGMVPLANSLIMYVSIITEGLDTAVNRFLMIDLNRADAVAANATFNTAFFASTLIVTVLLPFILFASWTFPSFFQVPSGLENASRLLFAGVMLTFCLSVIGSNFEVSTLALHRFDLLNLVRGLVMTTRIGTVTLLFLLIGAQVWQIGLGFLLGAMVQVAGGWLLWRWLTPELHIRFANFDRMRLRKLLGFSAWSIINRVGMLLFLSLDLVIINLYLGVNATGEYGTLILFPDLVRNVADTVTSVLNPAIVARYALNDYVSLKALATRSVKLLGLALALPIGLLCGLARPFLSHWLGSDFQRLDILLIVMVGHLSINLATLPLSYVLTSYNKVKVQGLVTLGLGVVNVLLAIILAVWLHWGALGVAIATACVLTIRNLFFLSGYSAYIMKAPWWTFYPTLLGGVLSTIVIGLVAFGLTQIWPSTGWSGLFEIGLIVALIYSFCAFFIALNREERRLVVDLCPISLQHYLQWI
ncbi:MAG: oligosaccharide flippase family protein [Chloroflexi bacterium]|nr:oligosaccharide flippase family protein [Chloroflexota bacterium]